MKIEYNGDINDILKAVKHIMLDKNIMQKDVCKKTGWSKSTVSNLLGGRTSNVSINVILTLVNAIDCKLMLDIDDIDI